MSYTKREKQKCDSMILSEAERLGLRVGFVELKK